MQSPFPFAAPRPAPPRPSPIIPAYLGTWQAGEVLALTKDGHLAADTTRVDPEWSSPGLLPPGVRIQFTDGYDKRADVAYLELHILPPFPANAWKYPPLRYHYTGADAAPRPRQEPLSYDFHMLLSRGQDVVDTFGPVGAVLTSVSYEVAVPNQWSLELFVAKNRQQMWAHVGIPVYKKDSDGVIRRDLFVPGWQVYHRVAEYQRR